MEEEEGELLSIAHLHQQSNCQADSIKKDLTSSSILCIVLITVYWNLREQEQKCLQFMAEEPFPNLIILLLRKITVISLLIV